MAKGDLIQLDTEHFHFSVWCADISKRRRSYTRTRTKRRVPETTGTRAANHSAGTSIKFEPKIVVHALDIEGRAEVFTQTEPSDSQSEVLATNGELRSDIELHQPLFFENLQYLFEWEFSGEVQHAHVGHRLQRVADSFRFVHARRGTNARLHGTIQTGNDVGWFRLPLHVTMKDGRTFEQHISFEVLPTKMVMHSDLANMYRVIDAHVPLWRFQLAGKTEQRLERSQRRENIELLWLANFRQLREQFEHGLKVIAQSPHRRLQAHTKHVRAHRLKHRVPHKLAEKVREDFHNGRVDRRYRIENKRLSVDTPENQFIRRIVAQSRNTLQHLEARLRTHDKKPENQRLSDAFFDELRQWQAPLTNALNHTFLKEVSPYTGRHQESLVLQQKAGYSAVYRTWQQLKLYLDVLGDATSISLRSVAQLYEVWCFLRVAHILEHDLGFERIESKKATITQTGYFEFEYEDNALETMAFEHPTSKVALKLAYEPTFSRSGLSSSPPDAIHSFSSTQRPDIYLEATFPTPDSKQFVWLFDAKYRIASSSEARQDADEEPSNTAASDADTLLDSMPLELMPLDSMPPDFVPPDAINQMHRYRDALIRIRDKPQTTPDSGSIRKSRPVVGAYCLYPGFFDQRSTKNPYQHAIDEVGIGAFALLPGTDNGGAHWLREFLRAQLCLSGNNPSEQIYLREPHRIPADGMHQVRHPDLLFMASLGETSARDDGYFNAFEDGTARHYHMPVKTFGLRFSQHIAHEIRYLALAPAFEQGSHTVAVHRVWPVTSVQTMPRSALSADQTGRTYTGTEEDGKTPYYLFTLGKPVELHAPFGGIPQDAFRSSMAVTTLSKLQEADDFSTLEQVYGAVISQEFG